MDRLVAAGEKRDGDLWAGDSVELFLDVGHKHQRGRYCQFIINPNGVVYDARNGDTKWDSAVVVKTGRFPGGWTVEAAVPLADLNVRPDAFPRVWGLNINRSRPELGEKKPAGVGLTSTAIKVVDPAAYREGEDSAWSPTWCESSHIVQRFGHALFEVATEDVAPPEEIFEPVFKADFDDGQVGPFANVEIREENWRGTGKCIAAKDGAEAVHLGKALANCDDMTLIVVFRMPNDGRMYYYGRAPDGEQCDADRHEVFITKEAAAARTFLDRVLYDTHSDKMAWKTNGRLEKAPGPWAMMTGHFGESSIGSVISPGKDWAILRTTVSQFRRQTSQGMVPLTQNYPRGLTFAGPRLMIDDIVIFRGLDVEPPEKVTGVAAKGDGDGLVVSWDRAKDNTLAAYYRVLAGQKVLAETQQLSARLESIKDLPAALTVVACDLYGNVSAPSDPVRVGK
jgi:hypothetical protein